MYVVVMGKILGKCDSWDQLDTWSIIFYKVEFNEEAVYFLDIDIKKEKICDSFNIDFETGEMQIYWNEGELKGTKDIMFHDWSLFPNLPDYNKNDKE